MTSRDFLSIRDVTPQELTALLDLAADIKAFPEKYRSALADKALALIFEKPSLRTRVSFDVGIHQLGGFSISLQPAEIQLGKRESVHDVAKNLERMVQGIMIRSFSQKLVEDLAYHASIPVINGLTDSSHPCQALSDFFTIRELKGSLGGLKLCFVGDGNNVAQSLMFAAARTGVSMTVACPRGYEPDPTAVRLAQEDAISKHTRMEIVHDPVQGVTGSDVVYTDVWASMGQEAEAAQRKKDFAGFQVNAALMSHAKPDAIFMHCLPAHRGEEVTDEVIDGLRSVVFQQAENRLHAQKALLVELMK
jgi:ornithine carbamoyltransferase